jgi:dCMP deaminase
MKQYDWDVRMLKSAEVFRDLSHCAALGVVCLLEKDGAIISTGINGTLPGMTNCDDIFKKINGKWHKVAESRGMVSWKPCEDQHEHKHWSKKNEVHAEINAIGAAAKAGRSTEGATAYLTHSPCNACVLALATAGITRVVYTRLYHDEAEATNKLSAYGIDVMGYNKDVILGEDNK